MPQIPYDMFFGFYKKQHRAGQLIMRYMSILPNKYTFF